MISVPIKSRNFIQVSGYFIYQLWIMLMKNLPLNDALLKNAEFVYYPKRAQATISQVVYFMTR